ncbi:hypothetical protein FRC09_013453 [Ceratobasidium sp. 395]|nr:hypothetical protein FRC09_013453 [Ceratobasidium sp. 395]
MSDLVVQLSNDIRGIAELLTQTAEADYTGGLSREATNALEQLLGKETMPESLSCLRLKVQNAKKKLAEVRPKRGRSKRKKPADKGSDEDEEEDTGLFWQNSFIEYLAGLECDENDAPTPEAFFSDMMQKSFGSQEDDIVHGLELVVKGVREPTAAQLKSLMDKYQEHEVLARLIQPELMVRHVGKLSKDQLATIYLTTSADEKSPVNERTRIDLYQNLMCSVGAVQFALGWQAYKKDDKQPIVDATYRKKHRLSAEIELDKTSKTYKTFCSAHRYYVRGANRLAYAYGVLGSLVLLCPQLSFSYFRGTSYGANLNKAIEKLEVPFVLKAKRERGHQALVYFVIKESRSATLLEVFNHLDEEFQSYDGGEKEADAEE